MRDHSQEIDRLGARLVVVGNGSAAFAAAFREDTGLDALLLVDPDLAAYRAAGLRRGRVEVLSPRILTNAVRAAAAGFRQTSVQGDPWQLGGVFVFAAGGELVLEHASREAGDHVDPERIVAALAGGRPADREDDMTANRLARILGNGLSLVLDPTIALSFDRTGFLVHSLTFDPGDLDVSLAGRRCLITGANAGLGFETALGLADLGADVELLCRDRERAEAAAERIRERTGNSRVTTEVVDVSDLFSIRGAAARLAERPVDVLIHNAGLLPATRQLQHDGLELTFATHVVGPHLLTRLLTPALQASGRARVVWMSSGGMYTQKLSLQDLDWSRRPYDGVTAYAQTKRMQVILAQMWAEHLRDTGTVVNAMHPGWADTQGVRDSLPGFRRVMQYLLRTPAEGADTVVWLAASEPGARATGKFFFDRVARRTHFLPTTRENEEQRQALWQLVDELASRA